MALPKLLDRRHRISQEFTGHPSGARWVFRFAGTWINSYPTRDAARDAAREWEIERRKGFDPAYQPKDTTNG